MPGAQRTTAPAATVALAACALVCGLACATTTRVALDEDADFAAFRTWDWHGRVAPVVDGRSGDAPDLDGLLSRLIHRALAERGYARSRRAPDFFVTYDFEIRRRARVELTPRAPYLLSSMHSSASYWIEGSERTIVRYRELQLAVAVFEPGGAMVWKSVLRRELDGRRRPELAAAVAGVLARFPEAPETPPTLVATTGD